MKRSSLSNKNIRCLCTGVLVIVPLLFLVACGKANTPVQTTTPTLTVSTTPTKWSADGLITSDEYSHSVTYDNGDFEISWETDAQYIYIGIKAKTTGWVSIGFNATSQLKDIDYVFGWVSSGKAHIADEFSEDFHGQHKSDVSLGGKEDITDYGGQEKDGYTVIQFKRALVTGDSYDANLSSGDIPIIWAHSSFDDTSALHSHHGFGNLQI